MIKCVPGSDLGPDVPVSRRARKKQATFEALHDAALALVEERGLCRVTIEDITEQADVAPRTFFNYFSSKEEAVIGRNPDLVADLIEALRARPADEAPFESLAHAMIDSYIGRAEAPDHLLRRMRVVKSEPLLYSGLAARHEQLEQQLTALIADRMGADPALDPTPSLVVLTALAAWRAALMHWCDQGGAEPLERVLGDAFRRIGAGLDDTHRNLS
jgi:AcrR family transcriptional regulator